MSYSRDLAMSAKDAEDFANDETVVILDDVEDTLSDIANEIKYIAEVFNQKASYLDLGEIESDLLELAKEIMG